ncbi:MAG TPA: DUF1330 domain-containing protein [Acetobacteraceae bacterium]|nr:DUF1330 domain-containing protein [Acetobacteraceae bacterium]
MPAYMIFMREEPVRDAAAMADYQRMNREKTGGFSIKPLVVYGATEAVEGKAPDGVIVLEFPDVTAAKAWYNSPGYQAALPHRLKAAEYRAFIVEGFQPPAAAG